MKRFSKFSKYLVILLVIGFSVGGCASDKDAKYTVYMSDEVLANENALPAWMGYGFSLIKWEKENTQFWKPKNRYNRELEARRTAAKIWQELKEVETLRPDKDLDDMVKILEAGFIQEYVWIYFNQDDWKRPRGFDIGGYIYWERANLPNHKPVYNTGVQVEKIIEQSPTEAPEDQ